MITDQSRATLPHGGLHGAQGDAGDRSGRAEGASEATRADRVVDPDRPGEPVQAARGRRRGELFTSCVEQDLPTLAVADGLIPPSAEPERATGLRPLGPAKK